jgi:hypothetical protein
MAGAKIIKFMEELPDSCPPAGAAAIGYDAVYRYVNSKPVTDQDFDSHKALEKRGGKGRPRSIPPCIWAATSLFVTRDSAYEVLPKVRQNYKLLATVKITQQCGVGILKRQHISFWRYATFKPKVHSVEELPSPDEDASLTGNG